VTTTDRPTDDPPLAEAAIGLRARLLHAAFAAAPRQLETTLPPDDPDAELAWRPVTYFWTTSGGVQPVIMPLWRRLD
jgi:hypothetical protein